MPDDAHGVLQDVHWSGGSVRLLPDLLARQRHLGADLGEGARASCPTSTTRSSRASSGRCATGCASTSARHGRKFTPQETLERVVGHAAIDAEPYLRYLKDKLGALTAA